MMMMMITINKRCLSINQPAVLPATEPTTTNRVCDSLPSLHDNSIHLSFHRFCLNVLSLQTVTSNICCCCDTSVILVPRTDVTTYLLDEKTNISTLLRLDKHCHKPGAFPLL